MQLPAQLNSEFGILNSECGIKVRAGAQSKRKRALNEGGGKVFPHKQLIHFAAPIFRNGPVDCFGSIEAY